MPVLPFALGLLLTTQDKVNFQQGQEPGRKLAYEFDFTTTEKTVEARGLAVLEFVFGEKTTGGTKVSLSSSLPNMENEGEGEGYSSAKIAEDVVLDAFGMPTNPKMSGVEAIRTLVCSLTYLPNKKLSTGETFKIDWKSGGATYKGTGKLVGLELVRGRKLPKLEIKSVLHTGEESDLRLEFNSYYDKDDKSVFRAKGSAKSDSNRFTFILSKPEAR